MPYVILDPSMCNVFVRSISLYVTALPNILAAGRINSPSLSIQTTDTMKNNAKRELKAIREALETVVKKLRTLCTGAP